MVELKRLTAQSKAANNATDHDGKAPKAKQLRKSAVNGKAPPASPPSKKRTSAPRTKASKPRASWAFANIFGDGVAGEITHRDVAAAVQSMQVKAKPSSASKAMTQEGRDIIDKTAQYVDDRTEKETENIKMAYNALIELYGDDDDDVMLLAEMTGPADALESYTTKIKIAIDYEVAEVDNADANDILSRLRERKQRKMLLGRAREAVEAGQTEIAMATRVKELKKGIKQALRG